MLAQAGGTPRKIEKYNGTRSTGDRGGGYNPKHCFLSLGFDEELALLAVKNPSGATDSEEQLRCSEEWLRHREERALRARRDRGIGTRSVRNSEPVTTGEIW